MNPVEDFLAFDSGGLEKTAQPIQTAVGWAGRHPLLAGAALASVTPFATMAMQEGYGEIKGMVGRARGFKRMMDYNPALKKLPANKAKAMYNTLHNAAPDLAKDPVVASSWVNRMALQDEYVDPRTLADLGAAQRNIGRPVEYPHGQVATGVLNAFISANTQALKGQELGIKQREYELNKAKATANDIRANAQEKRQAALFPAQLAQEKRQAALFPAQLAEQQEKAYRQQQGAIRDEAKYQQQMELLRTQLRAERARARRFKGRK